MAHAKPSSSVVVREALTDATGIPSALETANGLCRDECREVPPWCGGGFDLEPTARCSAGKCVVVAGR